MKLDEIKNIEKLTVIEEVNKITILPEEGYYIIENKKPLLMVVSPIKEEYPDYSIISIEEYNEELKKKMENNYE